MGRVAQNSYQLISNEDAVVATPVPAPSAARTTTDRHRSGVHKKSSDVDVCERTSLEATVQPADEEFVPKIRWPDLGAQIFLHAGALYGVWLLPSVRWWTLVWSKCGV